MNYKITSYFHQKESFRLTPHNGIDLKMETGEPIRTIKDGIIHLADYGNLNAGKTVFVKWEDGKTAIYGHLSRFAVRDGQHVKAGDLIGYSGNTGFSTGSHLHFGLKQNGHYIDPSPYVDQIQNMNNPHFLAKLTNHIDKPQLIHKTASFFDMAKDQMDMYKGIGDYLSLNVIYIFKSLTKLVNNSVFMQYIQHIFQLFP